MLWLPSLSMKILEQTLSALPADIAADITPYFITVDPENDSPEILHRYLQAYRRVSAVGIRYQKTELDRMTQTFSAPFTALSKDDFV